MTLYRTPNDPQFVKVGVVVVNHENQWEKNGKQWFFLVKWFSMVYLEPVNPTLTLQMKFLITEGVLRPLEAKIGAKNSLKWHFWEFQEKFYFFSKVPPKWFLWTKIQNRVCFLVTFWTRVRRSQHRTTKDPELANLFCPLEAARHPNWSWIAFPKSK